MNRNPANPAFDTLLPHESILYIRYDGVELHHPTPQSPAPGNNRRCTRFLVQKLPTLSADPPSILGADFCDEIWLSCRLQQFSLRFQFQIPQDRMESTLCHRYVGPLPPPEKLIASPVLRSSLPRRFQLQTRQRPRGRHFPARTKSSSLGSCVGQYASASSTGSVGKTGAADAQRP